MAFCVFCTTKFGNTVTICWRIRSWCSSTTSTRPESSSLIVVATDRMPAYDLSSASSGAIVVGDAAPAVRADDQAATLAETVDLERREEQMQQTGMIGVADVLGVHLPVVRQHFGEAANNLDLPVSDDPL